MIKVTSSMLTVLVLLGAVVSCSQAEENGAQQTADKRLQAEADCARLARDKTGYNPSSQSSTSSSIGKGAAIGAATGAAVGALSSGNNKKNKKNNSNNTGTKVVQGAAIGGAAGAGIAAISDNEKKNTNAQSRDTYQREYQSCLNGKGF